MLLQLVCVKRPLTQICSASPTHASGDAGAQSLASGTQPYFPALSMTQWLANCPHSTRNCEPLSQITAAAPSQTAPSVAQLADCGGKHPVVVAPLDETNCLHV
ncbi:MAG TPA: hypothetical protein VHB97_09060, partial [Polyangia bacterium]|nr:hypothetical protein [Polyangia bacterium]